MRLRGICLPQIISPHLSLVPARSAHSPILLIDDQIFSREWMALRAVSPGSFIRVVLQNARVQSTLAVLPVGHWFNVQRMNAIRRPTKMIEFQARRDRSNRLLVRKSVRWSRLALGQVKHAVSTRGATA